MKDIVLPLKGVYFDQIKAGTKTEEFRLITPYWTKRFSRQYRNVILTRGYPKSSDTDKRLVFPWKGITTRRMQHPHFGPLELCLYVIDLKPSCNCKRSDAWRCAVEQGLSTVSCHCKCHQAKNSQE